MPVGLSYWHTDFSPTDHSVVPPRELNSLFPAVSDEIASYHYQQPLTKGLGIYLFYQFVPVLDNNDGHAATDFDLVGEVSKLLGQPRTSLHRLRDGNSPTEPLGFLEGLEENIPSSREATELHIVLSEIGYSFNIFIAMECVF